MKILSIHSTAALILCLLFSNGVTAQSLSQAQAQSLIQPFYALLSGKDTAAQVRDVYASDWASYSSHTKYKGLEETIGNIQYLTKNIIPDLQWNIKDVAVTSDNRIVVIGEATGSPVGDKFFGKPITPGSSFTIMSIDVHTVEKGKIVKTYHIEDWFSAIKQLSPKS